MGKGQDMTRKDYVLIAEAIAEEVKVYNDGNPKKGDIVVIRGVAYSIAERLQRDNMRFNLETFIKACGFVS